MFPPNQQVSEYLRALTEYYRAGRSPLNSEAYIEVYGGDFGQRSWNGPRELVDYGNELLLTKGKILVDFGAGPGGCALFLAQHFGVSAQGFDINSEFVEAANLAAKAAKLDGRAVFSTIDVGAKLALENSSVDAVLTNDVVCHLANPVRRGALNEFARLLKSGGRLLVTDTLVLTGSLSEKEMEIRSGQVPYFYTPWGENEKMIAESGLKILKVVDTKELFLGYTRAWLSQYETKRDRWLQEMEAAALDKLIERFKVQECAVAQGRLTRVLYLAEKP